MSEDAIVLISYSGYESKLGLKVWMSWLLFGVTAVVIAGVVAFDTEWKHPFVGFFVVSMFLNTPLSGMNIESGLSIAIRDITNVLLGVLVAILFLPQKSGVNVRVETSE